MSERLIIIGAGGHGKVVSDIALKCGYSDICFVDDKAVGDCMGYPIIGKCEELYAMNDGNTEFVIAVGNNATRKHIAEAYNLKWVTLIHPSAQIGSNVTIGAGTVVMANAVINACASIGKHCIVNSGAVVEHDNVLGDYVHISPRAALGGAVAVGAETHIGIGATVRNNIEICGKCMIGAGAVVVDNIVDNGVYVGVPAKMVGEN
jgi:sugar O-acyltransferase (sialic acid O-acetyltransferase NeuD family)